MLHAKFQDIGLPVLEKKILEVFFPYIWPSRSRSYNRDHSYKLSFSLPRRLHMKFGFDWPSGFIEEEL